MNYLVVDFNKTKEKQLLFDVLKDLDGIHIIQINKYKKSNSRYAFYFAYVLTEILKTRIYADKNGFIISETKQLHEFFKIKYNPILIADPITAEITRIPRSTTKLDDNKFINEYQEVIMADHAGEPFFIEWHSKNDEDGSSITDNEPY